MAKRLRLAANFLEIEEMKTEILNNQPPTKTTSKRAGSFPRSDPSPKLNELKVSYRRRPSKEHHGQFERPILNRSEKCYEYLRQAWDPDTLDLREEFLLICLDHSLAVNGWVRLHAGGFETCGLDLRLLFGIAVTTASSAIVIAHNHPTGCLTPSPEDRNITKRIAEASRLLGIRLLDHLIVSSNGFYSFHESEPELFQTDLLLRHLRA